MTPCTSCTGVHSGTADTCSVSLPRHCKAYRFQRLRSDPSRKCRQRCGGEEPDQPLLSRSEIRREHSGTLSSCVYRRGSIGSATVASPSRQTPHYIVLGRHSPSRGSLCLLLGADMPYRMTPTPCYQMSGSP